MVLFCVGRVPTCAALRALVVALGVLPLAAPASVVAADIMVSIDEAKLIKLPERVATLVISNPAIADASVQSGGVTVITGKGYGATNIIALDRSGAVLAEHVVEVRGPRDDVVVVYRGASRQTYSCTLQCEPRMTLGDGKAYFEETVAQTSVRNSQAQGVAPGK